MNAVPFDTLKHRTTLSARLVAQTAFRVGAGRALDAVTTDLPVLRSKNGALLVPGSSLKGVMRSSGERLLRACALPEHERRYACDIFGAGCCEPESEEEKEKEKRKLDAMSIQARVAANRALLSERMCMACATFGAQGWSAVARFTDAMVQDALVSLRDGVGMDRDLGRAANRIKYDYEVVDPGAWFELKITLDNAHDWQLGLLLATLDAIDEGAVRVGGFGSRGLGWFAVRDLTLERRDLAAILGATGGTPLEAATLRAALTQKLTEMGESCTKSP